MEFEQLIRETIGWPGRMISGSKSAYSDSHKQNVPIFNANLCTKLRGKIWFGDLDLTLDKDKLATLAIELNEDIYVLRELDARFENEAAPKFEEAAIIFKADGGWEIGTKSIYRDILDPEKLSRKS